MKKYKVTYMRKFKAKNEKFYCALELTCVEPSKDKNDGTYFGHRTYSILTKAENIPSDVLPDDYIKCSVSFDKESGRPFAYNFSKCSLEESFDAITQEHIDSIEGTVFVGGDE